MAEQSSTTADPVGRLRDIVRAVAAELGGDGTGAAPTLERPPRAELGDYSTNAAMLLAPVLGAPPREIAERLSEPLATRLGADVERVEVAGPGFLNVFLADAWCREGVRGILAAGEEFGAGAAVGDRVAVEFVSANPTGPLTAAGGRHAAFGDSVARILERAGHGVERHYYLNDTGGQVVRFAQSISARMTGADPPEGGYEGAYVAELAEELAAAGADPEDLEALGRFGTGAMRERIAATLERYGVSFDRWYSERSYQESGKMEAAIAKLREAGHVYDSEGATWLRTSEFGDDKDRVLVRSDGEPTYFAADISYHLEKSGEFDHLINVLGVDHHGYVARMRAAFGAAGADPGAFEAPMIQLVHIVEAGERAQMSKRKGEFVTLDELVDDIGVDAARWFMVQRSNDTQIDLDLELARRQSSDNPVYYVQYAHARIASILRKAEAETGWETSPERIAAAAEAGLAAAAEPAERALVKRLLAAPAEVRAAAELRAPHRLGAYATETAADFHAFYRDCQVVGAGGETEQARLALCVATKSVIASTLGLLGVGAPERM
ncbi:MAG TPA: arginine--tRNA ligase [Solirubrobacterales bacterium]